MYFDCLQERLFIAATDPDREDKEVPTAYTRRYEFTQADRSKGGKVASSLPGFKAIQLKGRDTTALRHGQDCLRRICQGYYRRKKIAEGGA